MEAEADPNKAPETLIHAITETRSTFGAVKVVELLLKAGAEPLVPESTGGTLTDLAIGRGEEYIAAMLSRDMPGISSSAEMLGKAKEVTSPTEVA